LSLPFHPILRWSPLSEPPFNIGLQLRAAVRCRLQVFPPDLAEASELRPLAQPGTYNTLFSFLLIRRQFPQVAVCLLPRFVGGVTHTLTVVFRELWSPCLSLAPLSFSSDLNVGLAPYNFPLSPLIPSSQNFALRFCNLSFSPFLPPYSRIPQAPIRTNGALGTTTSPARVLTLFSSVENMRSVIIGSFLYRCCQGLWLSFSAFRHN